MKILIILFSLSLASLPSLAMPNPEQKLRAEIHGSTFNKSNENQNNKFSYRKMQQPRTIKMTPSRIKSTVDILHMQGRSKTIGKALQTP